MKTGRRSNDARRNASFRLARRGLKASARPGGVLWLEPKANITDAVREIVRANKAAILAELEAVCEDSPAGGFLHMPCNGCGGSVRLLRYPEKREELGRNTGAWYRFACACGNEGYVCERDFRRWEGRSGRYTSGDFAQR